jgi:hypothetical protein
MYKSQSISPTKSIRTNYSQKRCRSKINRVKSKAPSNLNINNYYMNNANKYKYKDITEKPYPMNGAWSTMMSKTSKEGQNMIKPNPKRYESNINADVFFDNNGEKRHFKESTNYDYTTKTQITTLPGGVKRSKYEIKDDMYFRKPYNESRLYKMIRDYNCDINYEQNYEPITQGYNVNCFPIHQRFYGSYKRGMKNHDIFNINHNSKNNNYKGYDCLFYRK